MSFLAFTNIVTPVSDPAGSTLVQGLTGTGINLIKGRIHLPPHTLGPADIDHSLFGNLDFRYPLI